MAFAGVTETAAALGTRVSQEVALPQESGGISSFAFQYYSSADLLASEMPFAFARDHQARKLGLANVPATRVGRYCETRLRFSRTLRTRVALSGENSFAWDDLCGRRRVLRLLLAFFGAKRRLARG